MATGKKLFWSVFALALTAALWFVVPPIYRIAYAFWHLSSAKRFNIEEATKDGIVYIPIESQRFAIPKEYVGGVSTSHDGSPFSISLRFVLPDLQRYDPNNPHHRYQFSTGGGWKNQLFFNFGASPPVSAGYPGLYQSLYQHTVVEYLDSTNPKQKMTRREPEADEPEGLEIYSTPNYQFTWPNGMPDNKLHWTAGKDIYVQRDGEKIRYLAECDRVIPGVWSPKCEVKVEFANDVDGRYVFAREHFKHWKRIHEHLTGLVHSWMQSPAVPPASR